MSETHAGKMGPFEWARHEEKIAATSGIIDVGIGKDLVQQTGMPRPVLADSIRQVFHDLIDRGANSLYLTLPQGKVRVYVIRRGKSVDVGTRVDFERLGWKDACDLLDRQEGLL